MNNEKLFFSRIDFDAFAPNTFRQLWNDQDFADVTLATMDGQQIRVHKLILSSASNFFRNILLKNPHPSPLLYLNGIKHAELEMIMRFIYMGQCDLETSELEKFIAAGKSLEINGIFEHANADLVELKRTQNNEQELKTEHINVQNNPGKKFEPIIVNYTGNVQKSCTKSDVKKKAMKQNVINFSCNQCDNNFSKSEYLDTHRQAVHEGKRYYCDQCDYKAIREDYVVTHKQSVHDGAKFSCDQCDFKTNRRDSVSAHKNSQHVPVSYECNQCEFKATQQKCFDEHTSKKHGCFKYACDQCNFQSTQQKEILNHKNVKHAKC